MNVSFHIPQFVLGLITGIIIGVTGMFGAAYVAFDRGVK